jgi:antitoxin ParD1/3/4
MSNVAKVSVTLTAEMAALVDRAVASGEYATGSEVIREALREWKQRRTPLVRDSEQLRALCADGVAGGPGRLGDIASIKAEARRRLLDEDPRPETDGRQPMAPSA